MLRYSKRTFRSKNECLAIEKHRLYMENRRLFADVRGLEIDNGQLSANNRRLDTTNRLLQIENDHLENVARPRICSVCRVRDCEMFFLPCGHIVTRRDCGPQLYYCPVCRELIAGQHRAFSC